ncbi:hypothetical protein GIB67_025893 [Kingdonia uniflora]|uniref:Uncharacterized protein n=1 Tax=Kingdonia uniflora TaxID=39325 RepID=A0A7J7LPD3_9MAGN|nr:hypothetical protein GIB67_025893 [Kingdonia uniflora]
MLSTAIIYEAFRITCKAKVVPRTAISSPHSGQAIVILKSREEAEMVIDKLEKGCLMLPRGRPLIASPGEPPSSPGKPSTFPGHLTMELKHHTNREEII